MYGERISEKFLSINSINSSWCIGESEEIMDTGVKLDTVILVFLCVYRPEYLLNIERIKLVYVTLQRKAMDYKKIPKRQCP